MSDLISRKKVIDILEKEKKLNVSYDADITIFSIEKGIRELPTAYSVDQVVEELESFAKLAEDRWTNGTSKYAYQEHKCWVKAIEIVKQEADKYNNGWIACGERFPDNDKKQYIVQKTSGFIDILGFTKDAYKLSEYDFAEYKGKKKQLFYDYDSEYGYTEWECEAWQPLPEPFKEND